MNELINSIENTLNYFKQHAPIESNNEWKLISDENFPQDERLLLCYEDDIYVGEFCYKDEDGVNRFSGESFLMQPTHWMYLPPKPEVKNE